MEKGRNIFYGWWILISGFLIMAFLYAPIANLVSIFIKPVTEDLGIGRAEFTMYFTVCAISGMIIAPIAGVLMKKMNIKIYMTLFTLLGAGAYIGFSFATKLSHFFIFAVPMGMALVGAGLIPVSVLITNWFNVKRGLSLGIALSGTGFGSMLLNPLVTWIITAYGWRTAYLFIAILILVIILPMIVFVIKLNPADKGLLPLGAENISNKVPTKELQGVTQKEAFRSVSFWSLCLAIVVGGIVVNSISLNMVPYLTDIGSTVQRAAMLASLAAMMIIVAKLLVGRLYDKLGLIQTLAIIVASDILCFFFLMKGNLLIPGILFAVFAALGSTAVTVTPAFLTGVLFGERDYSSKYGTISLFISLGAALAPIVSGLIYNINHSYGLLIKLLIVFAVIEFILFFIAVKFKPKYNVVSEASENEALNLSNLQKTF